MILPADFYDRSAVEVARELLGKRLVRRSRDGLTCGRIVEVEAYLSDGDPACHAHKGQTRKNASMFGPPGRAYVYAIHSRWCLNAVTEPAGTASAVLIRAVEPLAGEKLMALRRGTEHRRDLTRGPGRLCEAFRIDRALDGWSLSAGRQLWIEEDDSTRDAVTVGASPRIGISSAQDLLLRFFVAGNPFLSGTRRLNM